MRLLQATLRSEPELWAGGCLGASAAGQWAQPPSHSQEHSASRVSGASRDSCSELETSCDFSKLPHRVPLLLYGWNLRSGEVQSPGVWGRGQPPKPQALSGQERCKGVCFILGQAQPRRGLGTWEAQGTAALTLPSVPSQQPPAQAAIASSRELPRPQTELNASAVPTALPTRAGGLVSLQGPHETPGRQGGLDHGCVLTEGRADEAVGLDVRADESFYHRVGSPGDSMPATGKTELPEVDGVAPPLRNCLTAHQGQGTRRYFLEAIWQLESKGLKIHITFNPAVLFLGICPKEVTT